MKLAVVSVSSGHEDWPKVVEAEESSLAESLFNLCLGAGLIFTKKVALAAKKAGAPKTRQVKISACAEPSRGPEGTTDVIVYPEVKNVRAPEPMPACCSGCLLLGR